MGGGSQIRSPFTKGSELIRRSQAGCKSKFKPLSDRLGNSPLREQGIRRPVVRGYKTSIMVPVSFKQLMPKRKVQPSTGLEEDYAADSAMTSARKLDPQEVQIYIKQLKRALKFLPLGSRAYYYISGELVRAGRQLKLIGDSGGSPTGHNDRGGSSPRE